MFLGEEHPVEKNKEKLGKCLISSQHGAQNEQSHLGRKMVLHKP